MRVARPGAARVNVLRPAAMLLLLRIDMSGPGDLVTKLLHVHANNRTSNEAREQANESILWVSVRSA